MPILKEAKTSVTNLLIRELLKAPKPGLILGYPFLAEKELLREEIERFAFDPNTSKAVTQILIKKLRVLNQLGNDLGTNNVFPTIDTQGNICFWV